jgi:hypothetical protein
MAESDSWGRAACRERSALCILCFIHADRVGCLKGGGDLVPSRSMRGLGVGEVPPESMVFTPRSPVWRGREMMAANPAERAWLWGGRMAEWRWSRERGGCAVSAERQRWHWQGWEPIS